MGIAGIGVAKGCALKILGLFGVSYIPPRSRITGNFDTAKSQGATTARRSADGSSLLSKKKDIMDIRGIWRKWKEQNAPTRKQKTQKKIGTSREFGEIRRRKRTNQKIENSKKIRKSTKSRKAWKSPHERQN